MIILSIRMAFMCKYFVFVTGLSIFYASAVCGGSDAISAGGSLFPNQTLISKEGKFELGFFSPGNSTSYYVGIWYKNIPVKTVVWVLNRNDPIPYSQYKYAQLELSNGSLLLRSGSFIFWEDDYNVTEAVILDTGEFILRNASAIVWRSFNHPTDTWLPGADLDYEPGLFSWTSPNDPSYSTFSLSVRLNGSGELSIMAGDTVTWSSGPWRGGTFLSLSDNSDFNDSYNFTQFLRDDNLYLTYNVFNRSVLSRIVINYMGKMMHYRWSGERQAWVVLMVRPYSCSAYASCGPNTICNLNHAKPCSCLSKFKPKVQQEWDLSDFSNGCVRRRPLQCNETVGFIKVTTNRFPSNSGPVDLPDNTCELFCSKNCSCNAYAYVSGGQCLLFTLRNLGV